MASILLAALGAYHEALVIRDRLTLENIPFSFQRWSREVLRSRREQEISAYLKILLSTSSSTSRIANEEQVVNDSANRTETGTINHGADGTNMSPGLIYNCPLITKAQEGLSFYIRGRVLKTCERFSIDFVLHNEKNDIALHFNPRLPQNYIVRNSKINGTWGEEERCSALPFLLHRDSKFLVQILVTAKDYSISVNGRHFAHYRHRLPVHLVKAVEIRGDVADVSCEQSIIGEYPEPACEVREILYVDDTNQELTAEQRNQFPVPYYGKLRLPFDTSHVLHIHGRLKLLPDSFYVNLQCGSKIWPHPLIHFHFNPRFNSTGDGKHVLCCNSWLEDDWAKEERTEIRHAEFYPSRTFKLRIQRTYSNYQVYMNNDLINEFRFRDNGHILPDTVYIQGDFVISEIFVSNSYEEYPMEEE